MCKVYGIDLGTTYSVISTLDDSGMPLVIQNIYDGKDTLASAVYFQDGGDPVVGEEAKNQAEFEPDKVVQFVKREIGKETITRTFDGVDYDAITISALILKRMKAYADEQGHDVNDVVITCPAYFGTEERNATKQAGQIAGLNVLNIVNEPTAAALNYCCREFQENKKILIYDLGGGTFDITLINLTVDENGKSSLEVLDTGGDDHLGGADWDKRMYNFVVQRYQDETGKAEEDITLDEKNAMHAKVEEIKMGLTNMQSKSFTIKDEDGEPTRLEVTKEQFEEQTADLVERTMGYVQHLLESAEVSNEEIDQVLLVGGSTKMPMIKDAIENAFPGKWQSQEPDLAVAKGAALAAAIEWNEKVKETQEKIDSGEMPAPDVTEEKLETIDVLGNISGGSEGFFKDILSRSFGPGIMADNVFMVDNLIFVGDPSPATVTKTYGTMADNQTKLVVPIFENISKDHENTFVTPCRDLNGNEQPTDPALKVKYLGEITMELPPGLPQGAPIEIKFDFSVGGLNVTVTNSSSGETVSSEIVSANTYTEEEVEEKCNMLSSINTSGQM